MSLKCSLVLKNVSLPNGTTKDISIKDGLVVHLGMAADSENTIDCKDLICIPAAIDMHVHMRGGDVQNHKETWETGSKSALAGGVASVIDQPNTIPPVTDKDSYIKRFDEALNNSYCNFGINGSVMPGWDIEALYSIGVCAFGETFFAESSFGSAVDSSFLKSAFEEISKKDALATVHAEIIDSGEDDSLIAHERLRGCENEFLAVKTILDIAKPGLKLHFCHISSPKSVSLIKSRKKTFEVMPHHLFLSYEMFNERDGFGKVNPPLRSESVRKKLLLMWDAIDVIASDHAPHTVTEKKINNFSDIPSGIPGVETMLPLLINRVLEKKITLHSVIEKTVINPSKILGIKPPGFAKGSPADFALYPKEPVKISADNLFSKAGWTPYEEMSAVFPYITVVSGNIAYNRGEFFKGFARPFRGNGYKTL